MTKMVRGYAVYTPWLRRPLFWGVVLVLALGAWYLKGYVAWWGAGADARLAIEEQEKAFAWWEKEGERLTDLYKNDTYGGQMPEETLALFIEALEAEDYELASKYYVVEDQKSKKDILSAMKKPAFYIQILKEYKRTHHDFENTDVFEIKFFNGGAQQHIERFILNEYTEKWKLESI